MFLHLTLLLFVNGYIQIIAGCDFWEDCSDNALQLLPRDNLVFVGETLKMICSPSDASSIDITSVRLNVSNQKNESWMIPDQYYSIVGSSLYANVMVTDNFTESTTVQCLDVQNIIDSTFIYAETPLQNIENFTAVYLYQDHISLTWDWPMKNKSEILLTVSWSYSKTFPENFTNPCSLITKEGCKILEVQNLQFYLYVKVCLSVTKSRPELEYLTPSFNTSLCSSHTVYIFNNTKSGPPVDMTVLNINSTCFKLSWKNPSYIEYCLDACSRFYDMTVKKVQSQQILFNISKAYNDSLLSLCDLEPYTDYQVLLRLKREEVNPWSNPASITFTTDEDRPLVGPPVLSTNYFVKDCVNDRKTLYIYWQTPSSNSVRGHLTGFLVNSTHLRSEANYFMIDIECQQDYNASIYSKNSKGYSLSPSVVYVPSKQKDFSKELQFKVEETFESMSNSSKNVIVTWNSSYFSQENVSIVIYSCEEYFIPNTCTSNYRSTEVSLTKESLELNNTNISDDFFGFALKFKNGDKQGIIWTDCVFRKEAVPDSPTGLQVSPGYDENSLQITWVSTLCNRKTYALIEYYTVYICPTQDLAHCSDYNVSSTKDSYLAGSLNINQNYYVYLRAMTPYQTGRLSGPKMGMTKSRVDDIPIQGILSGIFATLGGILFIFCLVYFTLKCKKGYGDVKNLLKKSTENIHVDNSDQTEIVANNNNGHCTHVTGITSTSNQTLQISNQDDRELDINTGDRISDSESDNSSNQTQSSTAGSYQQMDCHHSGAPQQPQETNVQNSNSVSIHNFQVGCVLDQPYLSNQPHDRNHPISLDLQVRHSSDQPYISNQPNDSSRSEDHESETDNDLQNENTSPNSPPSDYVRQC
ncbi:uncharacterized protein LOC106060983 isoform X2 [Biomphalaria glabrata]|uniref:Uncharacterized protein LOC106060983 isoform X2 n=1 Tax=Biomphalaria glabrata TaxID=6526 RepID=A0A9U8E6A9_BIOGL|nr:uncharacterized protein LOC106060983 isoform X2 [Biomphalaria glabrata]XP_055884649.1 uncharacterized protein LOC106060983 isoform X2 [Biomphalaria glabrata]